jgi:hypothetical protein
LRLILLGVLFGGCSGVGSPPPSGPAAAWATQLQLARKAAADNDSNAVLMQVDAAPVPGVAHPNSGDYGTLQVEFRFATLLPNRAPNSNTAGEIRVIFADAAPTTTLEVPAGSVYNWEVPDAAMEQQIRQSLAAVQLSAREAYTRALPAAQAWAARYHTTIYPMARLSLRPDRAEVGGVPAGVPAAWVFLFLALDSQNHAVAGAPVLRVVVDATSGSILLQKEEK